MGSNVPLTPCEVPIFAPLFLALALTAPRIDTLTYTISVEPSALSIVATLSLNASGEASLRLPSTWASENELWKEIHELRSLTNGAILAETNQPDVRVVRGAPGARVAIAYKLTASDAPLSHRTYFRPVVRDGWFLLVGVNSLVIPERSDSAVVSIAVRGLPDGAPFVSSMGNGQRQTFRAGPQELRNVVLAGGAWRALRVTVNRRPVHVLVRGAFPFSDSLFANTMSKIVASHRKFWNGESFQQQLVTLSPSDRGSVGGTHYRDAMVLDVDTAFSINDHLLALVSHESFHEWIGGRTIPAEGQDGALKWFNEGVNDYYADRLLFDARLISDSVYAKRTNDVVRQHYLSPYRDSSVSARVRDYWNNPSANRFPYQFGRLVSLVMEQKIRSDTKGRRGLDDVVRAIMLATRRSRLTDSLILATTARVAGPQAAQTLRGLVLDGQPLTLESEHLGRGFVLDTVDYTPFDAGLDIDASLRARTVTGVRPNGPAALAGLRDGMQVLGVDLARGNAERDARLRVRDGDSERWITWRPAGPSVRMPSYRVRNSR